LHRVELWQLEGPNLLGGLHLVTIYARFNNYPDSSNQFADPDGSIGLDGLKAVDYELEEPEELKYLVRPEKIGEFKGKHESDSSNSFGEDSYSLK